MHEEQGTRQLTDRPHVLYRMYDAADSLLYVGITCNPSRRFEKHHGDKPWWSDVARIELEQHRNRASVLRAEKAAITGEKPKHNIRHSNGSAPASIPTSEIDGLVGRCFHSWRELKDDDDPKVATIRGGRVLEWQGQIVDRELGEFYIVQLYSWLDGYPSVQKLVTADDMRHWTFYDDQVEMQVSLGCSDSRKGGGRCGGDVTHFADWRKLGMCVVFCCSHHADCYSKAQELMWDNGKPVLP